MVTREIIIYEVLIPSLQKLYKMDYSNIHFGVSERNVCARLALHMENRMRKYDRESQTRCFGGYYVDVEYDKMADGKTKQYENNLHRPKTMVSDLLIQSRSCPQNLLAVEMKRTKNYRKRREDRERLCAMVSSRPENSDLECVYDTLVGVFIIYSDKGAKLEIYENNAGRGKQTDEIIMKYHDGVLSC